MFWRVFGHWRVLVLSDDVWNCHRAEKLFWSEISYGWYLMR